MRVRILDTALAAGAAFLLAQSVVAQTPVSSPAAVGSVGGIRLIGEQTISNLTMVDGTLVGGLSGIDYNPVTGTWVALSDDRSDNNPARYYDLNLTYTDQSFDSVEILKAQMLTQQDGSVYPNGDQGGNVPDPESIRIDPTDGSIWWSSEGSQVLEIDPSIVHADPSGAELATYPLPVEFGANPDAEALGIRNNKATEGLTFSADGLSLFGIMEGPLYQDGPLSTLEKGTTSRIVQFDLDGNVIAQYAYPLDPIQAPGEGELADLADNGATEILAVSDTQFLVLERSGVPAGEGPWTMYVRLYLVDITGATDVNGMESLAGATYQPVGKTLVYNFQDAGLDRVDNLEGMTWGPTLPGGSPSLVFVSDNNFDELSITQFLVFEVIP